MYLSKLTKAGRQSGMFPNQSPYDFHKLTWSFFPGTKNREWLYRVEPNFIYLQSDVMPLSTSNTMWIVQTRPFNPVVKVGDMLRFDTRVNATVEKSNGRVNRKSRRCSVVKDAICKLKESELPRDSWPGREEILHNAMSDWFKARKRQERQGFHVETLQVGAYYQYHFKNKRRQTQQFDSIDCSGILRVTDAKRFLRALSCGLGREKGFGCGLILVKRP